MVEEYEVVSTVQPSFTSCCACACTRSAALARTSRCARAAYAHAQKHQVGGAEEWDRSVESVWHHYDEAAPPRQWGGDALAM